MLSIDIAEHLDFASQQKQDEFLESAAELVWNRVMDRCYSIMDDVQITEFTQFLSTGQSVIDVIEKLSVYVPHIPEILAKKH